MIYLLIVDDERHIADWLYELFSAETIPKTYGFEFECYRAYDAQEALEIFHNYKVDLLLSDIYMPGMSGLEMLEIIHRSSPLCHTVFLTGYSDFDDIYRATRSRNTRYLSKTEEDAAIIHTVLEAARELTQEKERIDHSLLEQNMFTLLSQKELMLRILRGEFDERDLTSERLTWHRIPLKPDGPVFLLMGQITETPDDFQPADRLDCLNQMALLFQAQFSHQYEYVQIDYRPSLLVWVLQLKQETQEISRPKLRSTLEDFSSVTFETLHIGLSFMIDPQPCQLCEVYFRLAQTEDLLGYLLGQELGMILFASDADNTDILVHSVRPDESALPGSPAAFARSRDGLRKALSALPGLLTALEQGSNQKVRQSLDDILPVLSSFSSRHDLLAAELYFGISGIITGCINRLHLREQIAFKISLGRLSVWSDFATWKEAAEYFEKLCGIILDILAQKTRTGSDIIQRITEFVDQHLGEDLSLTRIGECLNYNPAYLSRIFKRITGKNLSSFINEKRLQYAGQLLIETNHNIAHIASVCGIDNAQYFITVFRKMYGITPADYRLLKKESVAGE